MTEPVEPGLTDQIEPVQVTDQTEPIEPVVEPDPVKPTKPDTKYDIYALQPLIDAIKAEQRLLQEERILERIARMTSR